MSLPKIYSRFPFIKQFVKNNSKKSFRVPCGIQSIYSIWGLSESILLRARATPMGDTKMIYHQIFERISPYQPKRS